jgi:tetratricopeptide (TPR) repeat protein
LWAYRLATATFVPTLLLAGFELLLRLAGYGHPASFFLEKSVAKHQVCVENLDFGRRFFPPALVRIPMPLNFPAQKQAGTYRIFVLGESAAMGFPRSSFGFSRILEVMLRNRFPETRFEVINTAMTAINSHAILPIARECAQLEPDLFIIYMGNNEVVGPFGASGVLGPAVPNMEFIRASLQVKATRTGELLASLLQRKSRDPRAQRGWDGMTMFAESHVRHDDPAMQSVYAHFDRNLRDMMRAGRNAGAQVIACTVASNLQDLAPFGSASSRGLAGRPAAEWDRHFNEGIRRESVGDNAGAVESYDLAAEIDGERADLQFRLARSLLAVRRPEDARRHFILARDFDTLRFRADSPINAVVRAAAADSDAAGVRLVDVEQACAAASADKLPGGDLFYEHVHFTFSGNYLLAKTLFETVVELLPRAITIQATSGSALLLTQIECEQRLAYTDWSRSNSLQMIAQLFDQSPFSEQLDAEQRNLRTRQELTRLQARLASGALDEAVASYRAAIELAKDDFVLRMDFASLLLTRRDFDECARQLVMVEQTLPFHPAIHTSMATLLAMQNRHGEAIAECHKALRLHPDSKPAADLLKDLRKSSPR